MNQESSEDLNGLPCILTYGASLHFVLFGLEGFWADRYSFILMTRVFVLPRNVDKWAAIGPVTYTIGIIIRLCRRNWHAVNEFSER